MRIPTRSQADACERVALGRLARAEVISLALQRGLDEEAADAVFRESEGLPLFVAELLAPGAAPGGGVRAAVDAVIAGQVDVVLFTTGVQVQHLFQIAKRCGKKDLLKIGLERVVKASIGPTTSEVLRSHDLLVDLETSHPKIGFLVKEAAEQAEALLQQIRLRPR